MSTTPRDILNRLQDDCFYRLQANAYLVDVAIIKEVREVTSAEIKKQLATLAGRSGKIGTCVIVQRPLVYPEADNGAGRSRIIQAFTVLEHPTLNAGTTGTGKTAQEIAIEIFDLFQLAAASAAGQVFSGFPEGAIVPDDSFEALSGWEVRFVLYAPLRRTDRVGTPLIDPESGTPPQVATLTCATPGATIYYTLDGTAPTSANAAAQVYAGPLPINAAVTLRAAAELAGMQPSSIAEADFE